MKGNVSGEDRPGFEDALAYAQDEKRRLEGEDLETRHPDDARHWEAVYAELNAFKEEMLRVTRERGRAVADEGQDEVGRDLAILHAEARRLAGRHEFWRHRRVQLESGDPPED